MKEEPFGPIVPILSFKDFDEVMKRAKLLRSWGRSSSLFDEKSENIENRFK